jgi:hypothetical protein
MKKNKQPGPSSPQTVETFGGNYYRLESIFRPRHETPPEGKRGKREASELDKEERKNSRGSKE